MRCTITRLLLESNIAIVTRQPFFVVSLSEPTDGNGSLSPQRLNRHVYRRKIGDLPHSPVLQVAIGSKTRI